VQDRHHQAAVVRHHGDAEVVVAALDQFVDGW